LLKINYAATSFIPIAFIFTSSRGVAKYCDEHVCNLYIVLSAHVSKKHTYRFSRNFLYVSPVADNTIRYVLPVWWMT